MDKHIIMLALLICAGIDATAPATGKQIKLPANNNRIVYNGSILSGQINNLLLRGEELVAGKSLPSYSRNKMGRYEQTEEIEVGMHIVGRGDNNHSLHVMPFAMALAIFKSTKSTEVTLQCKLPWLKIEIRDLDLRKFKQEKEIKSILCEATQFSTDSEGFFPINRLGGLIKALLEDEELQYITVSAPQENQIVVYQLSAPGAIRSGSLIIEYDSRSKEIKDAMDAALKGRENGKQDVVSGISADERKKRLDGFKVSLGALIAFIVAKAEKEVQIAATEEWRSLSRGNQGEGPLWG